eukprot:1146966-Pelagomonas_calceolata.AAC.3
MSLCADSTQWAAERHRSKRLAIEFLTSAPENVVCSVVQVGINAWRALRDVKYPHPAWRHLHGRPLSGGVLQQ